MRAVRLSILACQWCKLPAFQQWAGVTDAEAAKHFIYRTCVIDSRKDLDRWFGAAALFNSLIREPFMQSQRPRA